MHLSSLDPQTPAPAPPRRPLRPLHGIPEPEKRGRAGFIMSALLHGLVLLLIFLPTLLATQIEQPLTGGGGPGPAGGGGGGTGGSGGSQVVTPERVRFVRVQTPQAAENKAAVTPPPVVPPPKPEPEKKPEPEPTPPPPQPQPQEATPPATAAAPTSGTGGGTGFDGTAGTGPGRGGGVGSGVGTGRGSGVGPGTGGGPGDIYPPQVTQLAILPIPVPAKVRPYKLVAYFDVDERGKATLLSFNPSKDNAYNKKIREMLAEVRFRPAVRADGTPVRDTTWISAETP